MRPKILEEYIGQSHLIGEKGTLSTLIKKGFIPSLIFWGPPGTGKTTLANLLAQNQDAHFYSISAAQGGIKEVREIIQKAKNDSEKRTILFIDEIHRFSKSQQDSLLGAVEKGIITLIGATTENPSFEVINALLSRCHVYIFKQLSDDDLSILLDRVLQKDPYLSKEEIELKEKEALLNIAGGDARKLLSLLEWIVNSIEGTKKIITNTVVLEQVKNHPINFDKKGEFHYDIISAFIKSIRGSDPNAAVYWLARMIEGGEDEKFIARRMVILASEDIGNANPTALVLAQSTFDSVRTIGFPEARIILSQCAIYLATSPKSHASYLAIKKAQKCVKDTRDLPVPLHLRNAPTHLLKKIGYSEGYKYPHDFEDNFITQEYLPKELQNRKFYIPNNNSKENQILAYLKRIWKNKYSY